MSKLPSLTLLEFYETGIDGIESYSPFCLKVSRALKLAGLAYRSERAGNPAAFKRYNPTGQLPVLLVDGAPIADSTRIVRKIAELSSVDLIAGGGDRRAEAESRMWEELADTALNGFFVAARWADDRNWPLVRDAYFGDMPGPVRAVLTPMIRKGTVKSLVARDIWRAGPEACWSRWQTHLDDLDARVPTEGGFCTPRIAVADLAIFAQLQGLRLPLTAWQKEQIESRPRLVAWLDRIQAATRDSSPARILHRAA